MSNLDKIRIKSDGKPWTTTITNAETGELINCITRIEYVTDIATQKHYVKLWIDGSDVELDVIAPVELIKTEQGEI